MQEWKKYKLVGDLYYSKVQKRGLNLWESEYRFIYENTDIGGCRLMFFNDPTLQNFMTNRGTMIPDVSIKFIVGVDKFRKSGIRKGNRINILRHKINDYDIHELKCLW